MESKSVMDPRGTGRCQTVTDATASRVGRQELSLESVACLHQSWTKQQLRETPPPPGHRRRPTWNQISYQREIDAPAAGLEDLMIEADHTSLAHRSVCGIGDLMTVDGIHQVCRGNRRLLAANDSHEILDKSQVSATMRVPTHIHLN